MNIRKELNCVNQKINVAITRIANPMLFQSQWHIKIIRKPIETTIAEHKDQFTPAKFEEQ